MPDTPQMPPTPQTPPAPSSPTPPSGTPTNDSGGELANMVAPEYRYPNNETVPEYLRGKTAADAAALLQSVVESAARGAAAQPAPQPLSQPADDDYITAGHLRQAQQQALQQVNPWLQTVADQQATFGYNLAKRDHADIFKKYEPEIIQVLNRVPRAQWTLDVIQNAVTFVKGNHVNELLAEKTRELEATMHSTMRSTGRAGSTADSEPTETVSALLAKTPERWRARAQAEGITPAQVYEFCQANDLTPDEFFKQFGSGIVTDAVQDVSFRRGSSQGG
jgi:hypothetical protein